MSKANSNNSISRRGVMASIGAVTMLAPLSVEAKQVLSSGEVDPIFPAIQRHHDAYVAWLKPLHDQTEVPLSDTRYSELAKVAEPFADEVEQAAEALADIVPTTMVGAIALLEYIDAVNSDLAIPRSLRPTNDKATDFHTWPDHEYYGNENKRFATTWPFLVMANIAKFLKQQAA